MPRLEGTVALVTGASRGAGRGIANVLGEHGATVYVTGRSTRAEPNPDRPGTIEDTAEEAEDAADLDPEVDTAKRLHVSVALPQPLRLDR